MSTSDEKQEAKPSLKKLNEVSRLASRNITALQLLNQLGRRSIKTVQELDKCFLWLGEHTSRYEMRVTVQHF